MSKPWNRLVMALKWSFFLKLNFEALEMIINFRKSLKRRQTNFISRISRGEKIIKDTWETLTAVKNWFLFSYERFKKTMIKQYLDFECLILLRLLSFKLEKHFKWFDNISWYSKDWIHARNIWLNRFLAQENNYQLLISICAVLQLWNCWEIRLHNYLC